MEVSRIFIAMQKKYYGVMPTTISRIMKKSPITIMT